MNKQSTAFVKKKKRIESDTWQAYLMMIIPICAFLLLTIRPVLWNVRYSFFDYDGFNKTFVGIENFIRVFQDEFWWKSVWNTFQMAFVKVIIMVPFGFVLAVMLTGHFRGRDFFRVTNMIPFVLSMSVMSMVFKIMFSGDEGIINTLLMNLHIIDTPIEWFGQESTAKGAVVFVWIWKDLGHTMLWMLTALQSVDTELYESASIDGANKLQQVRYITIPQIYPVLVIIIMLEITGALKAFDLVKVLTDGGPNGSTEVMTSYLFKYYFGTQEFIPQQGYAAAIGVVATAIVTIVNLVYLKISNGLKSN